MSSTETRPSPAASPAGAPSPAETPKKRPPVALVVVLVAGLVGGLVFGVPWWQHRTRYVSTEDAQVSGDIVSLSSRVSGRLAEVLVTEGQPVKKGQVLARLEEDDFKAALHQAEAALDVARANRAGSLKGVSFQADQTQAQIAQATAGLRTAQAQLVRAEASAAHARAEAARIAELFGSGGASRQSLDASQTAVRTAEAEVASARSQVHAAQETVSLARTNLQAVDIKRSAVDTVEAQIKQAEAALETSRLQLAHATIVAPADGIVVRRMGHVGEHVAPGQGVLSMVETDEIWIEAFIEETHIRRVRPGAAVEVHVDAYPNKAFEGHVAVVNAAAGNTFSLLPSNNASGNFTKVVQRVPVKISVPDPAHELKPGMSAVIDIDTHHGS